MTNIFINSCDTWHAMFFRENKNGRSNWAYTVTDIPHLQCNNRICRNFHISTTTELMVIRLGRAVNYHKGLRLIKTQDPLIRRSSEITWKTKTNIFPLPMATKLGRLVTYLKRLLRIKFHGSWITWFCESTW